jgi:hypothetical protein
MLDADWRAHTSESKDELRLPVFAVRSHNRVYEHVPSAEEHRGLVAVELGTGLRSAFTTRLEFDPPLTDLGVSPETGAVFRVARERARREFARSVAEDGLRDVTHTDSRWIDRADGGRARAFRYDVEVPVHPSVAFTDDDTDGSTRPTVEAVLWGAIWPSGGAYAMAGGVYPVETLRETVDRRHPGRVVAPDVTVTVDQRRHRTALARVIRKAGRPPS